MMIELVLIISFVSACLYVFNEFRVHYYIKSPVLYYKDTDVHRELVKGCKTLKYPFIPTFWAPTHHFQTWLKTFLNFRREAKLNVVREYIEMKDQGIISLDWINVDKLKSLRKKSRRKSIRPQEKPMLLILPSAINTNVHDYFDLCRQAVRMGFKPVFFNRRGYSKTPLTTPKVVTYCDISDIREVLEYIKNQNPFSDIYALGFSMESGNLISYLGNEGRKSMVSGAVCVSSTFGCESQLDEHAMKQPYNYIITEKLKSIFLKQHLLGTEVDFSQAKVSKTIVDLQGEIHARSNHYDSIKTYLEYNNPLAYLNKVTVPILFIHAKDDPVIPDQCIPVPFFQISDCCMLLTTEYGGHCGFFQGTSPTSWADTVALEFLKSLQVNRNALSAEALYRTRSMTTGCL
ncbi:protein ABHD15-like [Hydractinia symbiolongicarpus]|uniref:protein ABHD15-like n=1 Tax=Hydractinia symbiolongicarpus TaxID=13093 RepID=UPI00254B552D|nr:protein ABHD15-like [Hydractinia symbiolongicarpus]